MIAVTRLIDLLDKPGLKYWANKIGLEGVSLKDYEPKVQKEGNIGHDQIEDYLKNGVLFDGFEMLDQALKGYEVLGCEVDCDNGFINGRIDLVLARNNEVFVVDFKRNDKIYISTKLQLSTYKHIIDADHIMYMNIKEMKLKPINIDTIKYYEIVKRLYQIKSIMKELKEEL